MRYTNKAYYGLSLFGPSSIQDYRSTYAQARKLTEKEEQLARREKEQQEQQIYIRLQYEADQREHLEQL